ncbi:MAG: GAF domain-containing protein [Anaerolineae bacterium]|nr:GAF domain-containing protein [Anaerolineae bacterium]
MLDKIKTLFAFPDALDEQQKRAAYLLRVLLVLTNLFTLLAAVISGLTSDPEISMETRVFLVTAVALLFMLLWLIQSGRVKTAGYIFVASYWLLITGMTFYSGGLSNGLYFIFILTLVVFAGGVLGGWQALGLAVVSILVSLAMLILGMFALMPIPMMRMNLSPFVRWLSYAGAFLLTGFTIYLVRRGQAAIIQEMQYNEVSLATSNRELESARQLLETRVDARTRELDRRSRYMEAAANIAYASSEILDVEQLMREVVDLIREQFELYYVGLFTLDDSETWAVLRSGTGHAGKAMLSRHHRIKVGEGMIGWCIANGQSRFAQRAEVDAVRLVNPELPETRAEAALPLRSRGHVLGAISAQSTRADFFDPETVTVLQTMADLVAVALDNAQLYQQSQASLETARRAYGDISREAWNKLLQTREGWGYQYTDYALTEARGKWRAEMKQAATANQQVLVKDDGVYSLAIPIAVRDQVIGVINFRRMESEGDWTAEDIELLESLAGQLGQVLENARLLVDTRLAANREAMVAELTAHMRETLDVDSVLRTAIREMSEMLNIPKVEVRMGELADVD